MTPDDDIEAAFKPATAPVADDVEAAFKPAPAPKSAAAAFGLNEADVAPKPVAPPMPLGDRVQQAATKAAVNSIQGWTGNTAHMWAPYVEAGMDKLSEPWTGPTNFDDALKSRQEEWKRNLDPALAAAAGLPVAIATGNAGGLMGIGAQNALWNAGEVDKEGGSLDPRAPEAQDAAKTTILQTAVPHFLGETGADVGKAIAGSGFANRIKSMANALYTRAAGLRAGDLQKLPEDAAQTIGQALRDKNVVKAGMTPGQMMGPAREAMQTEGKEMGRVLGAADTATGGKGFDLKDFVGKAREELAPILSNDPAVFDPALADLKGPLKKLLDRYEEKATAGVSFAEANAMKSTLQKRIANFRKGGKIDAAGLRNDVQRLLDDSIEGQMAPVVGDDFKNYVQAKADYGSLAEARKGMRKADARLAGNNPLGLSEMMMGAGGGVTAASQAAGQKDADWKDVAWAGLKGAAGGALATRLARGRGISTLAAQFGGMDRFIQAFPKVLAANPNAFGPWGNTLRRAYDAGPDTFKRTLETIDSVGANPKGQ